MAQPLGTTGEPSEKGAHHGGDRLAQLLDGGDVVDGQLLALHAELARVGGLGADHVLDQLVLAAAATPWAFAQLGR